ncbi:MAG: gliding motility-associated C-terminal domain-containing protein [Barnesiella sp.]
MRKLIFISFLTFFIQSSRGGEIIIQGGIKPAYKYTPESSTGLEGVYVIYGTNGVSIQYTADTNSEITWYKFDYRGAAYGTIVPEAVQNGNISILQPIDANCGYMIEQNGRSDFLWIVDYLSYPLEMNSLSFSPEKGQCDVTQLIIDGKGNKITYYSINGVPKELHRDLTLTYNTLEWNNENTQYVNKEVSENLNSFMNNISVTVPLCNTVFSLNGDQMLKYWGMQQTVTSPEYVTAAVGVTAYAKQETRDDNTNEWNRVPADGTYGGSAPVDIDFYAYFTDAVRHIEWQFSRYQDFSIIEYRYNDEVLHYTFRDQGTIYVRLAGSSDEAECESYSETFTISIGESRLEEPNIFSPGSSPGINDEWKVAYQSITSFKCWIFNKWGVQVFYFDDPSKGWDGKYKGKYVDPGVYYYVIEAKGADGVSYKHKGDINILRSKN